MGSRNIRKSAKVVTMSLEGQFLSWGNLLIWHFRPDVQFGCNFVNKVWKTNSKGNNLCTEFLSYKWWEEKKSWRAFMYWLLFKPYIVWFMFQYYGLDACSISVHWYKSDTSPFPTDSPRGGHETIIRTLQQAFLAPGVPGPEGTSGFQVADYTWKKITKTRLISKIHLPQLFQEET